MNTGTLTVEVTRYLYKGMTNPVTRWRGQKSMTCFNLANSVTVIVPICYALAIKKCRYSDDTSYI